MCVQTVVTELLREVFRGMVTRISLNWQCSGLGKSIYKSDVLPSNTSSFSAVHIQYCSLFLKNNILIFFFIDAMTVGHLTKSVWLLAFWVGGLTCKSLGPGHCKLT